MTGMAKLLCDFCTELVLTDSEAIGCSACDKWAHRKCAHLKSVPNKDIDHVNWVCSPCLTTLKFYLKHERKLGEKINDLQKSVEKGFKEVESRLEVAAVATSDRNVLTQGVGEVTDRLDRVSYAGAAKKNLLVVKSTDSSRKASEKKSEICDALSGVQVRDTRFSKSGNIVLNFESALERDEAANKVAGVENLAVDKIKKLKPKIMICYVNDPVDKDSIIDKMIEKNEYLQSIPDVKDKIQVSFVKDVIKDGDIKHYILMCDPEVKNLIHAKGNKIKLDWGVFDVRARYFATLCFHCLRFGHRMNKCPFKDSEEQRCKRCAGQHSMVGCEQAKKCLTCERAGKKCDDHSAGERSCASLIAEIKKIESMTDHGC